MTRLTSRALTALATISMAMASARTEDWPPFPVEWPLTPVESPADLSRLLDAPAGNAGFVQTKDGHFATADGRRLRFWGVNLSMAAAFPEPDEAPAIAAHIARLGINCVRLHFMDIPAPRGLIAQGEDTRRIDAAQLDRLDRFIAELKRRGVYTDLNLNVGRRWKAADGVRDAELLGVGKAATYFDPRLIALQEEFARQLLCHKNPYTGNEYRAEPAVAIVELVNENSLVESWFSGRLKGRQATPPGDVWSDIPPSYASLLDEQFNTWLKANRKPAEIAALRSEAGVGESDPVPRLGPEQFSKASELRFRSEASFYMGTELAFFRRMSRFLRDELKLRCPIAGTSDHNHYRSGYPLTSSLAMLDVVDGHVYWQHPNYLKDSKTGKKSGFTIGNTPMVDEPGKSTIVQLARTAVAGRPYTVSEVNHPFPNEYAAEGLPILAAYAAFQDWDGIFAYTLAHESVARLRGAIGHFDIAPDPVKVPLLAAGALMFLRGDIQPAKRTVGRSYSHEQVIESMRLSTSENPFFTPGFPADLPLVHATRITSLDGPPTGSFDPAPSDPIRSDTGEMLWQTAGKNSGCVTIDAARSQAIIGFRAERKALTRHLDPSGLSPAFCAVTLGALDDQPIARASRLLLTVGARVANTGMRWDEKRKSLANWGEAPTRIEPVTGNVVLRALDGASAIQAQPLDGAGRPLGPPIPATRSTDGWSLPLGSPPATWYVVTVQR
ncbi:MAG TPA: hypothetical protein PLU30_24635 [Verrucomicrobiae bacterium]|nr:hypothetical protein [Verrucomicrobiae bacterium]